MLVELDRAPQAEEPIRKVEASEQRFFSVGRNLGPLDRQDATAQGSGGDCSRCEVSGREITRTRRAPVNGYLL